MRFLPLPPLPLGLVVERPLDRAEAVHVLDFDNRRGDRALRRVDVQVHVGVDPQAALLHVAVGDAEVGQQQLQLAEKCLGLGRAAQIGLRDDFQQRRDDWFSRPADLFVGHWVVSDRLDRVGVRLDRPIGRPR